MNSGRASISASGFMSSAVSLKASAFRYAEEAPVAESETIEIRFSHFVEIAGDEMAYSGAHEIHRAGGADAPRVRTDTPGRLKAFQVLLRR